MTSTERRGVARLATRSDTEAIVSTLATAFFHDPIWGPVFPDEKQRAAQEAAMWRMYVSSAMRYPWTLVTPNVEAAAVWIPPDGMELTQLEVDGRPDVLTRIAGAEAAAAILAIYELLEAAVPAEPCFYLTLLGVHDDHRGHGLGMGLLAESLARIDALHAPAYLESSNPANNARYQSVGFAPRDRIVTATGHVLTTMWRPAH